MRSWIGALTMAFALVGASPATAASTRYAAPDGSGAACTSGTPCNLSTAITGAGNGDTVILENGDYRNLDSSITSTANNLTVEGESVGATAPAITFDTVGDGLGFTGDDADVERLDVTNSGNALALSGNGDRAQQVRAASYNTGSACWTNASTAWLDDVCWSSGSGAAMSIAGNTSTVVVRNLTAVSTADAAGPAMSVNWNSGISSVDVVNTIADSTNASIVVAPGIPGQSGSVIAEHSDLVGSPIGVSTDSTDISAAPVWAAGDSFEEEPSSPTVNSGVDSPANGPYDLEGDLRSIGTQTDIGADELSAAPTITRAVVEHSARSITVTPTLLTGGAPTTLHVQYGTETGHQSRTPNISVPPNNANVTLAPITISGLTSGKTYHLRVVASNHNGNGSPRAATVVLETRAICHFGKHAQLSLKARRLTLHVKCNQPARLTLAATITQPGEPARTFKVNSGHANAKPEISRAIVLRLSKAVVKGLKNGKTDSVKLRLTASNSAGTSHTVGHIAHLKS